MFDVAGCLLWVGRWITGEAERDTSHLVGLPLVSPRLLPMTFQVSPHCWNVSDVASPNEPCGPKEPQTMSDYEIYKEINDLLRTFRVRRLGDQKKSKGGGMVVGDGDQHQR